MQRLKIDPARERREKRQKITLIAVVAAVVVLLAVVLLVVLKGPSAPPDTQNTPTGSTSVGTGLESDELTPEDETNTHPVDLIPGTNDMLTITTLCGTLSYPAHWADHLWVEETELEEGVVVTFYCHFDDKAAVLFNVFFGLADTGSPVGYIDGREGRILVSTEYSDYIPESWSNEDRDIFYGMSEGLNDVIASIQRMTGFDPAQ